MKTVTDMQAQLERVQGEQNMLWDTMKPLTLLFRRVVDGERRQGAAKVCIRNILGTLRVLYLAIDLHQ
jgi:hypothetical protein